MGKSKRSRDAAESDEKTFDWGIDIPAKKRKTDDDATANATEVKKSKKDKKDKKDKFKKESRKEKKDKRKDLKNLPDEDAVEDEEMAEAEAEPKPEPEVKKEKKSKKENKDEKTTETNGDDSSKKDKKKKDKKAKKEAKSESTTEPTTTTTTTPPASSAANGDTNGETNGIDLSPSDAQKQDRHIVFVGNLPFTATAASISAHFASLEPVAVRCMKNKDDDKPCKGFAFVEFGKVWHMRSCLDKFHHSTFEGRKINVELTAGGGGKTKQRQDKIKAKNEKLNENRAKRIENEKTAKKDEKKEPASNGGIHPSRLARLPGLGQ